MNKLKKLTVVPASIIGSQYIISNEIFKEILDAINAQTETINSLIDHLESTNINVDSLQIQLSITNDTIQALATSIKNI